MKAGRFVAIAEAKARGAEPMNDELGKRIVGEGEPMKDRGSFMAVLLPWLLWVGMAINWGSRNTTQTNGSERAMDATRQQMSLQNQLDYCWKAKPKIYIVWSCEEFLQIERDQLKPGDEVRLKAGNYDCHKIILGKPQ